MLNNLELYIKDVIKNKKKGFFPFLVKHTLLPLSWLYRSGVRWRNWCYDKGWMRRYITPVPLVISIGNIVVGGTGKTPVTLLFAKAFYKRFLIAILSRGYRSRVEKKSEPTILCDGHGPLYPASECGDEPYIFAKRLPKSLVIVGGNRKKASCIAARAGAQIILLDDAMQHRALARDFDIVVVDVSDPFGHNHFLPRGFLREDKSSLSRANLVVLNHMKNLEQFQTVKQQIQKFTKAPVIGTNWQIESIYNLDGTVIESIRGKKIGMFCGIAYPEHFRETIEQEGATVVAEYCVPDHQKPDDEGLKIFAKACLKKGAEWLVCTEKDQVKLIDQKLCLDLPIIWFKMEMSVIEGEAEWKTFLKCAEARIK